MAFDKYGRFYEGIVVSTMEQIIALRLAKDCSEAKFALLEVASASI